MKKYYLIFIMILLSVMIFKITYAESEVEAGYAETYLCGDAYTVSIVTQPQMMALIEEKINYFYAVNTFIRIIDRYDIKQVDFEMPYQIRAVYAKKTDEEVLLVFRVKLRSLNERSLNGLSPESFILTGQVRDRILEFRPEIMMPFNMEDEDWEIPLIREKLPVFPIRHIISNSTPFNVPDHWNPLLMEEKEIKPMFLKEIRLIYRVPVFLYNWKLHVDPQPADGNTEGLRSCSGALKLPTIKNEITQEVYKYK